MEETSKIATLGTVPQLELEADEENAHRLSQLWLVGKDGVALRGSFCSLSLQANLDSRTNETDVAAGAIDRPKSATKEQIENELSRPFQEDAIVHEENLTDLTTHHMDPINDQHVAGSHEHSNDSSSNPHSVEKNFEFQTQMDVFPPTIAALQAEAGPTPFTMGRTMEPILRTNAPTPHTRPHSSSFSN
ncbi:hypothetical protein FEM48_ZijujUnG0056900 [Ziziphus jujuba var. spinosa]|uniref:Uncharacterized protein n=1 Tax=Ziziphus jujuba var. spinosa TaxID=714518 RepID=A0A978U922_ZIZJJ|nr:hypothetical protein FEM48_ZijujUnG0056900 [Ziziphus jujuba var. spinosa]